MSAGRFLGIPIVSTPKTPVREVTSPERGKDGLFVQPKDVSAAREVVEQHNRDRFAGHFKFADQYTGNTRTYDERGDYNCGRCNQAIGDKCLIVKVTIDRAAGSCADWENLCAGDPEMMLREKSAEVANYGVAKNGKGFGCRRCPYASAAVAPDSRGRELYCGKGDFRTYGTACCALNGAPVVEEDYDEDDDDEDSDVDVDDDDDEDEDYDE
jgi:hypothetical protein